MFYTKVCVMEFNSSARLIYEIDHGFTHGDRGLHRSIHLVHLPGEHIIVFLIFVVEVNQTSSFTISYRKQPRDTPKFLAQYYVSKRSEIFVGNFASTPMKEFIIQFSMPEYQIRESFNPELEVYGCKYGG